MLTREDDIDVHALHRQGWTISAIARHLGRDRKTIRAYRAGRQAGVRAPRSLLGLFEVFAPYCAQRLADDPHLWASTLFDELIDLGYGVVSHDDPPAAGPGGCAGGVSRAGQRRAARSR